LREIAAFKRLLELFSAFMVLFQAISRKKPFFGALQELDWVSP
jgi:hypothetical protein